MSVRGCIVCVMVGAIVRTCLPDHIPTNPQTNLCLSFVEKLLDMGTFLLENAACLSKMYGHYISQVPTKMWELVIFVKGSTPFLLDIKQKAGWLVGSYVTTCFYSQY